MTRAPGRAALLIALLGAAVQAAAAGAARAQPSPAHAQPSDRRVAFVVRGTPPDALAAEVVARLRGELRAARFEVETAAQPDPGSAREVVERAARGPGVRAAMAVFFDAGEPEVWVADARSGRTTVEPLLDPAGGERRANALAAKAVDLLRAVLSEIPADQRRETPVVAVAPAEPPVARPTAAPEPGPLESMLVAGVGWLRAGAAGTLAPALSLVLVRNHLGARLAASGLGSSPERESDAGRARIGQDVALFEGLACWRVRRATRACGAAGGGVERLRVTGDGASGFAGKSSTLWSGIAAVGASLAWTPGRWLVVALDARAVGAWPSTRVRVGDVTVVEVGGPGVWLTAGVGARL
ncbi:MAG TPA: hypothetical protein VHM31_22595 [Polyangia bacterium]|nr:hypothetical protein [Polyangia bacterium]